MEHEFPIGTYRPSSSDVPLLPRIFRSDDLKSRVSFTFQPDFPET